MQFILQKIKKKDCFLLFVEKGSKFVTPKLKEVMKLNGFAYFFYYYFYFSR